MKKHLPLLFLFFGALVLNSCNGNDDEYEPVSPVVLDITQVPYPKLSDYKFFVGELKNQEPAYRVIPYRPNSELFSDYAHKKRFVWMPSGAAATYNGDDNVLDFPVGAVMIKTFYYDDVLPSHTQKIIETRLLVKVAETDDLESGWKVYNYLWNDEQTEADLDVTGNGKVVPVSFMENNVEKTTNYRVPPTSQCMTCHKVIQENGSEFTMPIGPKPQNLNNTFNYGTSQRNQLQKWQSTGYIDNSIPGSINSVVDWRDTSKSLELRARSYIDINCAHCHRTGGHCDYVAMRFNFSNTDLGLLGLCMTPLESIQGNPYVIDGGNADHSELIVRISSQEESVMMPIIGRTLVHDEGVQLIKDWINSLPHSCD